MYYWNIKKLNKDLVKGLEQKEDAKYLLIYLVATMSLLFLPTEGTKSDYIAAGIEMLFGVLMLYVLFQLNKGNKGSNFLSRYFAIGWVTFIRSLVFILMPLFILILVILTFTEIDFLDGIYFEIVFTILYLGGFAYLNIKYWKELMKKIGKKKE